MRFKEVYNIAVRYKRNERLVTTEPATREKRKKTPPLPQPSYQFWAYPLLAGPSYPVLRDPMISFGSTLTQSSLFRRSSMSFVELPAICTAGTV